MTFRLPRAAGDVAAAGTHRNFTIEYGYDSRTGWLKAKRFPRVGSLGGETVEIDHSPLGFPTGEWGLGADYTRGPKAYRRVLGMDERGRVTRQTLGNTLQEDTAYDESTGLATFQTAVRPGGSLVRQVEYAYDHFLNLSKQRKNVAGVQSEELFTHDDLQRLRSASRSWGTTPPPGYSAGYTESDSYTYDDLGNLLSKSDYGTVYAYGTSTRGTRNAGPHAVHSVTKAPSAGGGTVEFSYDANGNLLSGDGRRIDFDLMDRPVRVCSGTAEACAPQAPWPGATSDFAYAPDGARYRLVVSGAVEAGFGPKTVYYVDKDYELTVWPASGTARPAPVEEERTYLGAAVVYRRGASREVRYQHVDRLGSLDAVTDESGAELMVDAHGYDPWGKPRGRTWIGSEERLHPEGETPESPPPGCEPPVHPWCSQRGVTTNRGFTGHEHLDGHHLIHMNGRVYDYRLGRFLSVDPFISNPLSPQSINPYSYIGNNPLSGVDPTGYLPLEIVGTNCSFGCNNGTGSHIGVPLRSDLPLPGSRGGVTVATSGATPGIKVEAKPAGDAGDAKQVAGKGRNSAEQPDRKGDRFVAADIHYALRDLAAPALSRDLQWPEDGGPPRANISLGEFGLILFAEASVVLTTGVGMADAVYDPSLTPGQRVLAAGGDVAKAAALAIPMLRGARAVEGAIAGAAGGAGETSTVLLRTSKQLQAKFKHAKDFGVAGNYSKANAAEFSRAIHQHINSPGVRAIQGTYHNQPVTHFLDPSSGLNVIADPAGNFISGWRLSSGQLQNVLTHGGL